MNPYCNSVNIPVLPLHGLNPIDQTVNHTKIDDKFISPKFIEFLDKLNLAVGWAVLFYREPNSRWPIHTDCSDNDRAKINWVYNGEDSKMNWYTLTNSAKNKPPGKTTIGTLYYHYIPDEVILAHSETITGTCLVQAGVPHDVITQTQPRHCVSISPCHKESRKFLTMNEALVFFKDYLL